MHSVALHHPSSSDLRAGLPSLQILDSELDEFGRTGRRLHLLHAVRALDDAQAELRQLVLFEVNKGAELSSGPEPLNER